MGNYETTWEIMKHRYLPLARSVLSQDFPPSRVFLDPRQTSSLGSFYAIVCRGKSITIAYMAHSIVYIYGCVRGFVRPKTQPRIFSEI